MYWLTTKQTYVIFDKTSWTTEFIGDFEDFIGEAKREYWDWDYEFFVIFHSERDEFDLSFWELTVKMDWQDWSVDTFNQNTLKLDKDFILSTYTY